MHHGGEKRSNTRESRGHLLPRGLLDLSPCCSILYSRSHSLTDACCGGAQGSVLVRPAAPLYHLSQVSAPPLAGGYTVGDKVFFTGKTHTFESGQWRGHPPTAAEGHTIHYTAPPSRTDPLSTHLSCSVVLLCSAGCIVTATGGAYLA